MWYFFLLIFSSQALNNLASSDSGLSHIYDNLYDYFRLLNLCPLLLPRNKGYNYTTREQKEMRENSFITQQCVIELSSLPTHTSLVRIRITITIRKSFIAKCVCTHNEFVLVLGASSTESTKIVQTTYN